jgi:hypothetical protein
MRKSECLSIRLRMLHSSFSKQGTAAAVAAPSSYSAIVIYFKVVAFECVVASWLAAYCNCKHNNKHPIELKGAKHYWCCTVFRNYCDIPSKLVITKPRLVRLIQLCRPGSYVMSNLKQLTSVLQSQKAPCYFILCSISLKCINDEVNPTTETWRWSHDW